MESLLGNNVLSHVYSGASFFNIVHIFNFKRNRFIYNDSTRRKDQIRRQRACRIVTFVILKKYIVSRNKTDLAFLWPVQRFTSVTFPKHFQVSDNLNRRKDEIWRQRACRIATCVISKKCCVFVDKTDHAFPQSTQRFTSVTFPNRILAQSVSHAAPPVSN